MMSQQDLLVETERYVRQLFANHMLPTLTFHKIEHTENVVNRIHEIASHYSLTDEEHINLSIAAWFHDTGHLFSEPAFHEEKSVELMQEFLNSQHVPKEQIDEITKLILVTKMPVSPDTLSEMIMCDADTYHLGTKEFKKTNKNVRKEFGLRNPTYNLDKWNDHTLALLNRHKYFTNYAIDLLHSGKEKNIRKLKSKIDFQEGDQVDESLANPNALKEHMAKKQEKKLKGATVKLEAVSEDSSNEVLNGKELTKSDDDLESVVHTKKSKKERRKQQAKIKAEYSAKLKHENAMLNKGIQTMLRLTSENHIQLSNMADNKASILISVNAIIISVILSVLLARLEVEKHLTIPTFIFLITALFTIIVSILATRPKISVGNFSREDVLSRRTNLLFFGNFFKSTLEEYQWAMDSLMKDYEYLYGSVVQDIYFLGVVLGKKYKLVRLAYTVFMIGMAATVIAFILAITLHEPTSTIIESSPVSPF